MRKYLRKTSPRPRTSLLASLGALAGGREWAVEEARRQHRIAIEALDSIRMPERVREEFAALADFVVVRKR